MHANIGAKAEVGFVPYLKESRDAFFLSLSRLAVTVVDGKLGEQFTDYP